MRKCDRPVHFYKLLFILFEQHVYVHMIVNGGGSQTLWESLTASKFLQGWGKEAAEAGGRQWCDLQDCATQGAARAWVHFSPR